MERPSERRKFSQILQELQDEGFWKYGSIPAKPSLLLPRLEKIYIAQTKAS